MPTPTVKYLPIQLRVSSQNIPIPIPITRPSVNPKLMLRLIFFKIQKKT